MVLLEHIESSDDITDAVSESSPRDVLRPERYWLVGLSWRLSDPTSILSGLCGSDLVRNGFGRTDGLGLVDGLCPILCSTSRLKLEAFLMLLVNSSDEE